MKYQQKSFSVPGISDIAWLRIFGKSKCCNASLDEVPGKEIKWKCTKCGSICETNR